MFRSCGKKGHAGDQHGFRKDDDLPPVDIDIPILLHLVPVLDHLGHHNANRERHNRHQIAQRAYPFPLRQLQPEQHDVAGLRIGEHTAAAQVGISVEKAARHGQQRAQ